MDLGSLTPCVGTWTVRVNGTCKNPAARAFEMTKLKLQSSLPEAHKICDMFAFWDSLCKFWAIIVRILLVKAGAPKTQKYRTQMDPADDKALHPKSCWPWSCSPK